MYELANLRLHEVERAVSDKRRVLIPLGSTEQHGRHAPYATDSILSSEVCKRIADHVDAIVAPVLPYGLSSDHEGFPGVPYLSVSTLVSIIRDLTRSFTIGGFHDIIFVNGHYTNILALNAAMLEINDVMPSGCHVFGFNYWDPLPHDILEQYLSSSVGLHANIGETSALLSVCPDKVDMGEATAEFPIFHVAASPAMVASYFFAGSGGTYRTLRSGIWGDATAATADKGEWFLDQIANACVDFIHGMFDAFESFPRD